MTWIKRIKTTFRTRKGAITSLVPGFLRRSRVSRGFQEETSHSSGSGDGGGSVSDLWPPTTHADDIVSSDVETKECLEESSAGVMTSTSLSGGQSSKEEMISSLPSNVEYKQSLYAVGVEAIGPNTQVMPPPEPPGVPRHVAEGRVTKTRHSYWGSQPVPSWSIGKPVTMEEIRRLRERNKRFRSIRLTRRKCQVSSKRHCFQKDVIVTRRGPPVFLKATNPAPLGGTSFHSANQQMRNPPVTSENEWGDFLTLLSDRPPPAATSKLPTAVSVTPEATQKTPSDACCSRRVSDNFPEICKLVEAAIPRCMEMSRSAQAQLEYHRTQEISNVHLSPQLLSHRSGQEQQLRHQEHRTLSTREQFTSLYHQLNIPDVAHLRQESLFTHLQNSLKTTSATPSCNFVSHPGPSSSFVSSGNSFQGTSSWTGSSNPPVILQTGEQFFSPEFIPVDVSLPGHDFPQNAMNNALMEPSFLL